MSATPAQLTELQRHLGKAVGLTDLTRFDWRRQTDIVQLMFIVARLFVDLTQDVVFVDGLINDHVRRQAIESKGGVKQFFNRRFHDTGFKTRRVLIFDTLGTKKMEGPGSGRHKLHFHAVIERPSGCSDATLKLLLGKIFGVVANVGRRQFHVSEPEWSKHYTHNGIQVIGPLGKVIYALTHAGTTYANLGLNGDKRSRRSPPSRGLCNCTATGLARGIPSNFVAGVVFCDHASRRAGKESFDAWVKVRKVRVQDPQPTFTKHATPRYAAG